MGKKLVGFTTRYGLVAAVMLGVCNMWSYAAAADVDQLLQQASAQAFQLRRDSATLESFTRSNVSWRSHAAQVNTIQTHLNHWVKPCPSSKRLAIVQGNHNRKP